MVLMSDMHKLKASLQAMLYKVYTNCDQASFGYHACVKFLVV